MPDRRAAFAQPVLGVADDLGAVPHGSVRAASALTGANSARHVWRAKPSVPKLLAPHVTGVQAIAYRIVLVNWQKLVEASVRMMESNQ